MKIIISYEHGVQKKKWVDMAMARADASRFLRGLETYIVTGQLKKESKENLLELILHLEGIIKELLNDKEFIERR